MLHETVQCNSVLRLFNFSAVEALMMALYRLFFACPLNQIAAFILQTNAT